MFGDGLRSASGHIAVSPFASRYLALGDGAVFCAFGN